MSNIANLRCRVCAKPKNHQEVFHNILWDEDLRTLINKTLPINVASDDKLPSCICLPCEDKVKHFAAFYLEVGRADQVLRDIYFPEDKKPTIGLHEPSECNIQFKIEPDDYYDSNTTEGEPTPNPVENPLGQICDVPSKIVNDNGDSNKAPVKLTVDPAEKPLVETKSVDLSTNLFYVQQLDGTVIYSCKKCMITFLTRDSAACHSCNLESINGAQFSENDQEGPHLTNSSHDESSKRKSVNGPPKNNLTATKKSKIQKVHEGKLKVPKKRGRKKAHKCKSCWIIFDCISDLKLHEDSHLAGPQSLDTGIISDTSEVNKVTDTTSLPNAHICNFCGLSFTRQSILLSHERKHLRKSLRLDGSEADEYF